MKKIISLFLTISVLLTLSSCKKEKNRTYNEAEVLSAAENLIKKSELLNYVYWGEGIGYVEDEETSNGYYHKANFIHLEELGFTTIEELKNLTSLVYTKDYSSLLFETKLSSSGNAGGTHNLARYYQKYSDTEGKIPDCIMVYSEAKIYLTDEVEYLYDTMKVSGVKGQVISVTLCANVKRNTRVQTREITVKLIEEAGGFRIDTPTYLVFDEYLEQ